MENSEYFVGHTSVACKFKKRYMEHQPARCAGGILESRKAVYLKGNVSVVLLGLPSTANINWGWTPIRNSQYQ